MLTFRMDETNFAEGEADGTRIVTGAGLKMDFDEFATDGSTLGLWHLHDGACQGEGTGLEDESGGHDFLNHGATSCEDGYRFVRADGDYMDATFAGQPALAQLTLECWVRDWQIPVDAFGCIAIFGIDGNNFCYLLVRRHANPALAYISVALYVGGVAVGYCQWAGTAVDALLASPLPWHVATVLDAPNSLKLFVNGVQRGQDLTGILALPAGDYKLRLGRYISGWTGYDLSAVVDEVRLSAAARYAGTFQPHRLLAEGAYASPTFDAGRLRADWLDLAADQEVPGGCGVALAVRAADETDAFGHPQAVWQEYDGDPDDLPDGRYLQWRSTLSASPDRFATPTLVSAEAAASEAGYDLYRAAGPDPELLDYASPWTRVGPGVMQVESPALDAGATHWFGVRPVSEHGQESPITSCEARIELDEAGQQRPHRPAGALALSARSLSGGRLSLSWCYRVGENSVVPQVFRVFSDGGTGILNYSAPVGEVTYRADRAWFDWTSDPLPDGVAHQLAVRAVAASEVLDEQPAVVVATPDASAPGQVDTLEAEVTL